MTTTTREQSCEAPCAQTALYLDELNSALHSHTYVEVRRRVFRQLVASLIYEGLLRPEERPEGDQIRFRISGEDELGHSVIYECWGRRCLSFDRVRLSRRPLMRVGRGDPEEAVSFSRFLLETGAQLGADPGLLQQFIAELEQTQLKDTLAQEHGRARGDRLDTLTYDQLETSLIDGHGYHPSYKSRLGFDYIDNMAFGPEFARELQPIWLAAHASHARSSASDGPGSQADLAWQLGAGTLARFTEMLRARGLDPSEFVLLPVHPWQWRRQIAAAFFDELREQRLVVLEPSADRYAPQQSIRTLANLSRPDRAYLKLSLSITNTSTSRVLAPHTVQNAPRISDWLSALVDQDPYLRDELRLILLREMRGVAYDPPRPAVLQAQTYGVLSCIWRESLHTYLEQGERAVPFNGLCHLDGRGRPLIEPWVAAQGAERWVARLLEVAIPPIVHLLVAHGIALEAHAQNLILIHRDGIPQRLALKDFHDGIRFSQAHLAAPGIQPMLCPTPAGHLNANSYLETDDAQEVRDFVHDAFFFINLAELALFLSEHVGLDERRFWSLARQVVERYQRRFPQLGERAALFDLFAPTVKVEQLTKRRLYPDTAVRVHSVRNALALVGADA